MSLAGPTLVISLHGGGWRTLDRQIQAGSMPNLRRLRQEGASGDLLGVPPTLTTPNWATLLTGLSPAEHGVYSRSAIGPDGRIVPYARSADLRFESWLDRAEAQGRRTLSLYAPLTGPTRFTDGGVRVVGDPSGPLEEHFGKRTGPRYEQFFPKGGFRGADDRLRFVRAQILSLRQVEEEALFLLRRSPTDLALVHLLAIDPLLHALWHHADPEHPHHDGSLDEDLAGFFVALDEMIARLIDAQGATTALVMSDHGFTSCENVASLSAALLGSRRFELCRGLGPEYLRQSWGGECTVYLDHKAIYVNRTEAGSEQATKAIIETLTELEEPISGRRAISWVRPAEDIFGPTKSDDWTVLVVEPAPDFSSRVGALGAPLFTPIHPERDFLVGTHDGVGLWALWGSGAVNETDGVKRIAEVAAMVG